MNNVLAVVLSFVYVFAVIGVAEGLRRAFGLPVEFTRKVVHIGVGMWAFGTAALFTDKWFAVIPPVAFIALNYISYRRNVFAAMEVADKSNLGTVYFPIAFAAVILLFFDVSKALMVALLMPMTWGDAFAAILGRRFGRHRYAVFDRGAPRGAPRGAMRGAMRGATRGATRSLEGSAAMFIFSCLSAAITLAIFGTPLDAAILFGVVLALFATVVEAISPAGLDNLLVPASGVLAYLVLSPWLRAPVVG